MRIFLSIDMGWLVAIRLTMVGLLVGACLLIAFVLDRAIGKDQPIQTGTQFFCFYMFGVGLTAISIFALFHVYFYLLFLGSKLSV